MMRENYCTKCKKYKEIKKPEILYTCDKALLPSSTCNNCEGEDEKIFEEEESSEMLKNSWFN